MSIVMGLRERAGKLATRTLTELSHTSMEILNHRVHNGNKDEKSRNQLHGANTDMRKSQELIGFIKIYCSSQEPYSTTGIQRYNFKQKEFNEECGGFYIHGQLIKYLRYGQNSYESSPPNDINFNLGDTFKQFLVQIMGAPGKNIAEHVM
jgi:hypothetical protein